MYFLFLLCLLSCAKPQPPVFKNVENIQISLEGKQISLQADALLFNPNAQGLKLKGAQLELWLDGEEMGKIDEVYDLSIEAESAFKVPFAVKFPVSKLKGGFLQKALSFFGGKKNMEAEFRGFVRVKAYGMMLKIPIKAKQKVKI